MRRFSRLTGALAAAAMLVLSAAPAAADNYDAKDGNGVHQTFAAKLVAGILHPLHLFEGLFGGVPTPINMTNSGAIDTTCVAGCSSTADLRPASSTITVVDSGTATTTGQSSVALVTGTPTASSFQTQAINGYSSGAVTVTGTFVATLAIEASYDGGTTYAPVSGLLRGTNITTASITGPAVVSLDVTGATHVRVRATAYTSGTPTVKIAFSAAAGMTKVLNGVKVVDSTGVDASDTTNHAVKVNVVAGAVGGGAATVADGADVTQGAKADAACASYTTACSVEQRLAALEKAAEDTTTAIPVKGAAAAFLDGWDTTQGLTTDAACAGDNTSGCTVQARLQRLIQRLTTINTTLASPFQAGGALGAGSAILGKISQVDSSGADATDTTNHAVKVNVVAGGTSSYATMPSVDITRPANTTTYGLNTAYADSTSAPTTGGFTMTGACSASGKVGTLLSITVVDSLDPSLDLTGEVWIFDSAVTAINDAAAFSVSDADMKKLVAIVPFVLATTNAGSGTNSAYTQGGLNQGFSCSGSANLRYLVKVKNAYVPGNAEVLTVRPTFAALN